MAMLFDEVMTLRSSRHALGSRPHGPAIAEWSKVFRNFEMKTAAGGLPAAVGGAEIADEFLMLARLLASVDIDSEQ